MHCVEWEPLLKRHNDVQQLGLTLNLNDLSLIRRMDFPLSDQRHLTFKYVYIDIILHHICTLVVHPLCGPVMLQLLLFLLADYPFWRANALNN